MFRQLGGWTETQVGELRKAGKRDLVEERRVGREQSWFCIMLSGKPLGTQGFGDVFYAFGIREPSTG